LLEGLSLLREQCRSKGDAEQLHDFRVVLRRLRLLVRLGRPLIPADAVVGLRAWGKRMALLTGPVRDVDVALEWLQGQAQGEEAVELLQQRRDRLWQRRRRRLVPLSAHVVEALAQTKQGSKARDRLESRIRRFDGRLATLAARWAPRILELSPARQHEFRRAIRWRRYLREIVLPRARQKQDALLQQLIRLQEAFGEHQNRTVISSIAGRLKTWSPKSELMASLERERLEWRGKAARALSGLVRAGARAGRRGGRG
jgi:CHAD domain-containing protein